MYHVILEAILCLDYSQTHDTGTEYRNGQNKIHDEGIKKMNIGQRIAIARKNAGMAQFELAEIANIRYNTIARIENGTLEPRLDLLEQIADILQVPLSVLLFGDETIDINITSRTLGWRIRMLRKESRMTQPELAQKAGISLTMLRQWELHPANPTISALEKIAEVL